MECGHSIKQVRYTQHMKCPTCAVKKQVVKVYKGGVEVPFAIPIWTRKKKEKGAEFRALADYPGADPFPR